MRTRKDYEQLFAHLDAPEPSRTLLGNIMVRISAERDVRASWRALVLAVLGIGASCVALVPAFGALMSEISGSSFGQYLSLLFSDPATVLGTFNEFMLSLMESLPVFGMTALLLTAFVLLGSLRLFVTVRVRPTRA